MKNYVKEYKGYKVPEGATHYCADSGAWQELFFRYSDGVRYFWNPKLQKGWTSSHGKDSPSHIIELPEETTQEWVDGLPPIGAECEALWGEFPVGGEPGWTEGRFKGGYDSKVWFGTSYMELVIPAHDIEFRPLKTQEQKDREAFIEWGKKGLSYRLEEQSFAIQILEQLADNGAKAPEGE